MVWIFCSMVALAGAPETQPMLLNIRQHRSGLDAGDLVDENGVRYSRQKGLALLETEPAAAPMVTEYRVERRRARWWSVAAIVTAPLPGMALCTTPRLVRHADAAEDALRVALLRYNTFGPSMDAALEELPEQ